MDEYSKVIPSHCRYKVTSDGRIVNDRGREKTLQNTKNGYLRVDLYDKGKRTSKRVHILVADAFIPNPDNKPDVNHRDGNKHNNVVDNLEWATKSENMLHAYRTGLVTPHASYGMRGHKNPNAGRKGKPVMIVETGEVFDNIITCANAIGGNDRRICDCIHGKQHTHCGYHFRYVD